jgi:hypothetical protein
MLDPSNWDHLVYLFPLVVFELQAYDNLARVSSEFRNMSNMVVYPVHNFLVYVVAVLRVDSLNGNDENNQNIAIDLDN